MVTHPDLWRRFLFQKFCPKPKKVLKLHFFSKRRVSEKIAFRFRILKKKYFWQACFACFACSASLLACLLACFACFESCLQKNFFALRAQNAILFFALRAQSVQFFFALRAQNAKFSSRCARKMQIFSSRCARKILNVSSRCARKMQIFSSRCARKILTVWVLFAKIFFALRMQDAK